MKEPTEDERMKKDERIQMKEFDCSVIQMKKLPQKIMYVMS